VAPIAGDTDHKDPVTEPAGFLAKGRVHGVGAAAVRSDWTYSPNRGTRDRTASARRSPRRSRGVRRSVRTPHPQSPQPTRSVVRETSAEGHGRCRACGRTERAHKSLGKPAQNAGFPHRPHPSLSWLKKQIPDKNGGTTTVQIYAVSGERRQPMGTRSSCSHRARVPGSTLSCRASSFCDRPCPAR
jgi:hypothetical protein